MWLLLASLIFYAWGEPLFVLMMIFSVIINYIFGLVVNRIRKNQKQAYRVITFCVIFNIGILFFYKYLGFVVDNINSLVGFTLFSYDPPPLPLGISFFTFQALSYVIDVYRQTAKVEKNPFHVGLYIAFFPALVAGPIVRFSDFSDQIRDRVMTMDMFAKGCARFTIGIGKKIILANSLAAVADHVFSLSSAGNHVVMVPAMLAWVGLIAYTLQIYFDFSSYSDMAIGLANMFGFELKENFNYPYTATTATEFWRRWHISLSTWFREYVYFPLGGSKPELKYGPTLSGKSRGFLVIRNLFVVWLLTGIWHGAEWTFIFWGLWYFVVLLFERTTGLEKMKLPKIIKHFYLLLVVSIGWLFFRSTNLHDAMVYLANLLALNDNGIGISYLSLFFIRENWLFFLLGFIFSIPLSRNLGQMIANNQIGYWRTIFNLAYPVALTLLYIICISYLTKGNYQAFIYFKF
jgi:alginate O-acetyltransferase complex protein AlgI